MYTYIYIERERGGENICCSVYSFLFSACSFKPAWTITWVRECGCVRRKCTFSFYKLPTLYKRHADYLPASWKNECWMAHFQIYHGSWYQLNSRQVTEGKWSAVWLIPCPSVPELACKDLFNPIDRHSWINGAPHFVKQNLLMNREENKQLSVHAKSVGTNTMATRQE